MLQSLMKKLYLKLLRSDTSGQPFKSFKPLKGWYLVAILSLFSLTLKAQDITAGDQIKYFGDRMSDPRLIIELRGNYGVLYQFEGSGRERHTNMPLSQLKSIDSVRVSLYKKGPFKNASYKALVTKTGCKEVNTFEIRPLPYSVACCHINVGYWMKLCLNIPDSISQNYPLFRYDVYNSYLNWDQVTQGGRPFKVFKPYADKLSANGFHKLIMDIRQVDCIAMELIRNIDSLSYEVIRDSIRKINPTNYPSEKYFESIVDTVIYHRPEIFFPLAQDLFQYKDIMFRHANNREAFKILKETDETHPLRKEYIQVRRNQIISDVSMLTVNVAFWTTIGFLVF